MAMEYILGLMEVGTRVNGKTTKSMARVYKPGKMVVNMTEHT